jgi:predicted DNA-binding transcriptional regulator AlpA
MDQPWGVPFSFRRPAISTEASIVPAQPTKLSFAKDDLLRRKALLAFLQVTQPTLDGWIASLDFPQPIKVGPDKFSRVYWVRSEVEQWLMDRRVPPRPRSPSRRKTTIATEAA